MQVNDSRAPWGFELSCLASRNFSCTLVFWFRQTKQPFLTQVMIDCRHEIRISASFCTKQEYCCRLLYWTRQRIFKMTKLP